jgi:hypothetical protein
MTDEIRCSQEKRHYWAGADDSIGLSGVARTGSEPGVKHKDVQRTVDHADPATTQLYDRGRFTPQKSAALVVEY